MKIQYFGEQCFALTDKTRSILLSHTDGADFSAESVVLSPSGDIDVTAKRIIHLPGEFEISEVLMKGFQSHPGNTIYKVIMNEITFAHFGTLVEIPKAKLFEQLGENIDVAFVNLSEKMDAKKLKDLIDTISPRIAIVGGDVSMLPKFMEVSGAKTAETNPMEVTKSMLPSDNTDIYVLPL